MVVDDSDFLCVQVHPGEIFMKEGLYPILAGYTPNGQPTYCARLLSQARDNWKLLYTHVAEGMTIADALVHSHVKDTMARKKLVWRCLSCAMLRRCLLAATDPMISCLAKTTG